MLPLFMNKNRKSKHTGARYITDFKSTTQQLKIINFLEELGLNLAFSPAEDRITQSQKIKNHKIIITRVSNKI